MTNRRLLQIAKEENIGFLQVVNDIHSRFQDQTWLRQSVHPVAEYRRKTQRSDYCQKSRQ